MIAIFVGAFLPRAIYSVSRSVNWYERSINFGDAILSQNWTATYQSYHPGVTTMWLSGIGLKLFSWLRGYSSEEMLNAERLPGGEFHTAVDFGVFPLAIIIALGVVFIYYLLSQLLDPRLALISAVFIAFNPFHITNSKVLHLDALLSVFMLIAVLLLIHYKMEPDYRKLVLSGVFLGLSLLTKSAASVLIPFGVLILTSSHRLELPESDGRAQWRARSYWFRDVFGSLFIWGIVGGIIFFILWPVMLANPQEALKIIRDGVILHTVNPHPNPVFFNGQLTLEDPGMGYYVAALLWRSTIVTLPLSLLGFGLVTFRVVRSKNSPAETAVLWILVYTLLSVLLIGIAEKKDERYILPVFLSLDVIAAYGLWQIAAGLRQWLQERNSWLPATAVAAVLLIQVYTVLQFHPYYGNHYNTLLGGAGQAQHVVAIQTQGEGLDLAAQYLNTLPDITQERATLFAFGDIFSQHFAGTFEEQAEYVPDPQAKYRIYYHNQVLRGLGGEPWQEAWARDQLQEPLRVIEFNDIPYVWIYETADN